jgi:hypothetical protein
MAATVIVKCKCCHTEFTARVADRKRGWAKFCSKSCKAKKQEARTNQYAAYKQGESNFRGSGVSRDRYLADAREYGGIPQYDRHGNYEGFVGGVVDFDNSTDCQNSNPYTPRDR